MTARKMHFEILRKLLVAALALSICLLSLHTHPAHGPVDQTIIGALIVGSDTDERLLPSHDALPDRSSETCEVCVLMRQVSLPSAGYVTAVQAAQLVIFARPPEAAVATPDHTEHYRPPIAVAV